MANYRKRHEWKHEIPKKGFKWRFKNNRDFLMTSCFGNLFIQLQVEL